MIMLPSVLDKLDDCIVYHTTTAIDDYLARFPSFSKYLLQRSVLMFMTTSELLLCLSLLP